MFMKSSVHFSFEWTHTRSFLLYTIVSAFEAVEAATAVIAIIIIVAAIVNFVSSCTRFIVIDVFNMCVYMCVNL